MATSDKKLIRITGRVIERKTKQVLPNLRVEAWDKDLIVKDAVGAAATDQQGAFVIELAKGQLNDLFANRHCVFFFKVFREGQLITSTEASVLWDRDAQDAEVVIKVTTDTPTPVDTGKTFAVSGQVRRADGSVFNDGFVQAFITIRGQERMLGETKPDTNGQFEIAYTLNESEVSQLANARVVVRVFDGQRIQLAESPSFIADTTVTVNLTVPNPPPPPPETLSVQGQVRGKDGTPISAAIVRAFIITPGKEILLGEAKTDSSGNYKITSTTAPSLKSQPANAQLEARVFDKKGTQLSTSSSPLKERSTTMDVVVSTLPTDEPCVVHGQVRQANLKPLDSGTVRIFGVVPAPETVLGHQTITKNDEGRYRIEYLPGAFSPRMSDATRVVVRAFDGQDRLLSPASPLFRANDDESVDITLSGNVVEPTYVVRGQVTRSGGGGYANGVVRIFGISGSQEKKLAPDAITDEQGRYEISYDAGEFKATVDINARVIVRVFDRQEKLLVSSEPFNAQPVKVVDLVVPPSDEEITFIVRGQVLKPDGAVFVGGAVRAFHEAAQGQTLLGEAVTDGEGRYSISYSSRKVTGAINLRVQVSDASRKLLVQSDLIAGAKREEIVNLTIPIAEAVNVVKGRVMQFDGMPLVKNMVLAYDRDVRSQELLGRAVTDNTGAYEISYTSAQFARAEKKSADLIVRAYKDEKALAANQPIASSAIIFNAQAVETVDLVAGNAEFRGPSEYEQIDAELRPLLQGVPPAPNVEVATLTDEETFFLASETGLDSQHISFFATAAKLGKRTGLAPEIFYGFARENLPTDLSALLAQNKQAHRSALEDAVSANIIPAGFGQTIDQTLEQLQQLVVRQAFEPSTVPGKASFGDLLKTSGIPDTKLTEFLTLQVNHEGSPEEFWNNVRANPSLKAVADDLQFTVQTGALTGSYLPMAQQIQAMKRANSIKTLRDLATRDVNDWKQIITARISGSGTSAIVGFPPDTPGNNDQEKIENYAASLASFIEGQFPTAVIASRIAKDNLPGKSDLVAFFAANPDFDLITSRIDKQAIQASARNARIADPAALTADLSRIQRLARIAPRSSEMLRLMADGLDSARSIARMGESTFVAKYGGSTGGAASARAVYERAAQVSATSLHLLANYGAAYNTLDINVLPSISNLKDIPDWQTLFGSLELCECEQCRSIHSAAAYLVDVLSFLNQRVSNNQSAKAVLFKRRPDIGHIELTCDNTNTPMPYVDLVNELLEDAVSLVAVPPAPLNLNRQTRGTAQELGANPEYLNVGAYNFLANQVYPWTLPFDMWEQEARIYLEQLGVKRHELMRAFQRQNPQLDPTEISIVGASLGLATVERQLLTGQSTSGLFERWGFSPNATFEDVRVLNRVPEFLRRSGLSYAEMIELIKGRWINYQNKLSIASNDPAHPDTCEIEKQVIANLDFTYLVRIPRFVRLWRKLGWTMRELDQAFSALNPPSMHKPAAIIPPNASAGEVAENEGFLAQLAQLQQLREEFGLPVARLLSWYGPLDTAAYTDGAGSPLKSLYEELFQNPTVIKLKPGETDYFALNPARTDLIVAHTTFLTANATIIATLRAALRISEDDLKLLISSVAKAGRALSLDNLSRLYRSATLSRALKLSIADFLRLSNLTAIKPFVENSGAMNTQGTWRFIEVLRKIRASGWSLSDLDYLLRHQSEASSNIAPTESDIGKVLSALRVDLRKIADENTVPDSPWEIEQPMLDDLLRKKLPLALPSEDAEKALALLENAWGDNPATQEKVYWDTLARFVLETSPATNAKPGGGGSGPWTFPTKEAVLRGVLKYLRRTISEELVKKQLSESLKLSDTMAALLSDSVKSPADAARSAMTVFLSDDFVYSDPQSALTSALFAEQFNTFMLLHKIAAIVSHYNITEGQLNWLFSYAASAGWMNVNSLPVTLPPAAPPDSSMTAKQSNQSGTSASAPPPPTFEEWKRLNDLFALRDSLPNGETTLNKIFMLSRDGKTTQQELLATLSLLTGWDLADLGFLAEPNGFNFNLPTEFQDERALTVLRDALALCRRLGMAAQQCRDLAKADLAESDARNIKHAVKAKYEEDQWLAMAKPLRDQLREQQRVALVSYLVTHPDASKGWNWKDANDLYSYFLIDVEMSPCQMTSRIKQAISSVQLFVQRCQMNLESEIVVNADIQPEWLEWKWMKNYRVWEANRKVFLYPENWIEPELRDNKSLFFKELENEIVQNEVTADTAETALLNYLEKLDAVSSLEICGIYHQEESDVDGKKPVDILHVFGRTKGTPHIYYYRRRMDGAYWTEWEKVDVDIEGDHLIPVVWNRRVRLLWPTFAEKTRKIASGEPDHKYWEIKIAWSEYKNKKWTAKKVSTGLVQSPDLFSSEDYAYPKPSITFKGIVESGELLVRVYARFMLAGESLSSAFDRWMNWPWFEFRFLGCNDEPVVRMLAGLFSEDGISPIVTPSFTSPFNMVLKHFANIRTGEITKDVYVLEGDFPSNSPSGSQQPFLSATKNTLTLKNNHSLFSLVMAHQDYQMTARRPFFFQDDRKTFFIVPEIVMLISNAFGGFTDSIQFDVTLKLYRFHTFYHPYLCLFIRELNRYGVDGLFRRPMPVEPYLLLNPSKNADALKKDFQNTYVPTAVVAQPYPIEDLEFSYDGAYSSYNWELFFHAPLLIANRLSQNQQFEDAQRWFHYIFDPTDTSVYTAPQKFWKTRPFFEKASKVYQKDQIQNLTQSLAHGNSELENQVKAWREHPFNPHLIARMRDTAYQKTVVMKYLDNLIAWGDQLFGRDTIESINEATQLYILAAEILGRRPEKVRSPVTPQVQTYNSLEPKLDEFSNALVQIENVVQVSSSTSVSASLQRTTSIALPTTLYFCIPRNDKMLGYWDTVADRLFKIRHCMNIEGVVRQLPLFEPPIDPALLVKAAAAGLDIGSVLSDINAALPHYRFNVMSQKATELCGEVKSLGGALLSALEKGDAEALSLLRSTHEINVLNAVRQIKERQIEEAKETLDGLTKSREVISLRHNFYASIEFMNAGETAHLTLAAASLQLQGVQLGVDMAANFLLLIPDFKLGSPITLGTTYGGHNLGDAMKAFSGFLGGLAGILNATGSMSATLGGYQRRWQDWKLQEKMAAKELEQVDKQISAANIRFAIAERDLQNHDLQIENAKQVDEFMRSKFTNRDLYHWMVSQISGIYFQSYQMAYDVAKRAERTYRFELGLEDSKFIQFGYWESLKKGLLAGELLYHDIKRMEVAYLDQNKREYEITKHISLVMNDPLALIALRETGECEVNLPEMLFDLDYPGHYLRRTRSMSLTIPCVVGPYTSINCTLTLLRSQLRKNTAGADNYVETPAGEDPRFVYSLSSTQSIATSSAQNDSGLFELNFRDERYLPFELMGAISRWRIELPKETNAFDFDTISDVVLQLRYTARDGGTALQTAASDALKLLIAPAANQPLARLFSLRHEFPNEWHRFLHPANPAAGEKIAYSLPVDLGPERFPFQFRAKTISINKTTLFLKVNEAYVYNDADPPLKVHLNKESDPSEFVRPGSPVEQLPFMPATAGDIPTKITLEVREDDLPATTASDTSWWMKTTDPIQRRLKPDAIEDIWIVCEYSVS